MSPAESSDHPEIQLSHLLPALWKALTRATRASEQMPAVESQVSILRRLVDAGPAAPAQLADELYLARPTISNLLRALEADGLVDRSPSQHDGRSVVVTPTAHGRDVLERFRRGRAEVLADAIGELDPADRERILDALQPLDRLLHRLESTAESFPVEERRPR